MKNMLHLVHEIMITRFHQEVNEKQLTTFITVFTHHFGAVHPLFSGSGMGKDTKDEIYLKAHVDFSVKSGYIFH